MFCVLFEVDPASDRWDDYLDRAKLLRPELERIDGFVTNVRYRSLTRDGRLLSFSDWRDEKSLVRWRTHARHHEVQAQGRAGILHDYRLRVGQITRDSDDGVALEEQRLDETEVGPTAVLVTTGTRPAGEVGPETADDVAAWLGLDREADGLDAWDVYDAVLDPGDAILMTAWATEAAATAHEARTTPPDGTRTRRVRVIRDYGLADRREAPQYYPDVVR